MSKQVTYQKGAPTRAHQTDVGEKYLRHTPSGKILLVKILEHKGKDTILEVLDDPEFDEAFSVPGTMVLYEIAGKEVFVPAKAAPKPAPKPAAKEPSKGPAPKPKKEKKPPLGKKERLLKVPDGKPAPRVTLEGFVLRTNYRNRLATNRAMECEKAKEKSCRCRCGGALHGKPHKPWFDAENALFAASPVSAITASQVLGLIKKFGGSKLIAEHKAAHKEAAAQKSKR